MSNKRWRETTLCIYFERRCSTLRCDGAWQIHAVRARASRDPRAFAGWTWLDAIEHGQTSLWLVRRGEDMCVCARVTRTHADTRVESRSNRRKRGQTRAKPWLTKEEANYMYIRVHTRILTQVS